MGQQFYLRWLGVACVVVTAGWLATRRVESLSRRRICRAVVAAIAITPFPLWVPGEGGFIVPAAMLLMARDSFPGWQIRGAVPITIVATVLLAMGRIISRFLLNESRDL